MTSDWWMKNEKGRVPAKDKPGRPSPGSRVQGPDGRTGTVELYEGQWPSWTYPVKVDHGVTEMWSTSEPTTVPAPKPPDPKQRPASPRKRGRKSAK